MKYYIITINDFERLRKYVSSALIRCGCELDKDRRDEIELFLIEKYWLIGKAIPTRVGKKKDPAIKWALREKLRDASFQNHTVSAVVNEDGEEVDIFEIVGENEQRYTEIEQWHDICAVVGAAPARALFLSLSDYDADAEKEQQCKVEQMSLF